MFLFFGLYISYVFVVGDLMIAGWFGYEFISDVFLRAVWVCCASFCCIRGFCAAD